MIVIGSDGFTYFPRHGGESHKNQKHTHSAPNKYLYKYLLRTGIKPTNYKLSKIIVTFQKKLTFEIKVLVISDNIPHPISALPVSSSLRAMISV